jgi:hypothetical protein
MPNQRTAYKRINKELNILWRNCNGAITASNARITFLHALYIEELFEDMKTTYKITPGHYPEAHKSLVDILAITRRLIRAASPWNMSAPYPSPLHRDLARIKTHLDGLYTNYNGIITPSNAVAVFSHTNYIWEELIKWEITYNVLPTKNEDLHKFLIHTSETAKKLIQGK